MSEPAEHPLVAFLGPDGHLVRSAIASLMYVDAAKFADAIAAIDQETTLGPLLDPSAYVDGRRFDNAKVWTEVLRDLHKLRTTLARIVEDAKPKPETLGTPISELSGRPGERGFGKYSEIAASWGHD